jgi:citrate lyase beta subunit
MTFARRSLLLTPGHQAARLAKAVTLDVDAVVFDLEDGVPPGSKPEARKVVARALGALDAGGRERMVRVNGVGTTDLVEDLRALPLDRVDALFVPKVRDTGHVAVLERLVACYEGARHAPVPFVLTIETPDALFRAAAIAAASRRTVALFFGSGDYSAETGCALTPDALAVPRALIAAAAGSAGVQAIDAAFFVDVRDAEAARADALVARALGFTGKVVFHPGQVAPVNDVFTPTAAEIARARSVIAAWEAARATGDGVLLAGGEFVAIDIVRMMERVLARAAAAASRAGGR